MSHELNNELVYAGAGAGKTTYLIQKAKDCFDKDQKRLQKNQSSSIPMGKDNPLPPHPRILLTTFTRKATRELQERLYLKASKERDFYLWEGFKKGVHVSTLHGVLSLFLKRHSEQVGFHTDFSLVSKKEGIRTGKNILQNILEQKPQGYVLLEEHPEHFYSLFQSYFEAWCFSGEALHSVNKKDFHQLSDSHYEDLSLLIQPFLANFPSAATTLKDSLQLFKQKNPNCLPKMLSDLEILQATLPKTSKESYKKSAKT